MAFVRKNTKAASLITITLAILSLAACSTDQPNKSVVSGEFAALENVSQRAREEGGLVLATDTATVLVSSDFKNYDVTSNSGLHFVYVDGETFIDSSTPGAPSYTRATPETLEQKGVPRERAARDAARVRTLLNFIGDPGSYKGSAVVERVDLSSFKVSVPTESMGLDGVTADLGDEVEFLVVTNEDVVQAVSFASLDTGPFYLTKFTEVKIEAPENVKG
jgi:hypothetical protein